MREASFLYAELVQVRAAAWAPACDTPAAGCQRGTHLQPWAAAAPERTVCSTSALAVATHPRPCLPLTPAPAPGLLASAPPPPRWAPPCPTLTAAAVWLSTMTAPLPTPRRPWHTRCSTTQTMVGGRESGELRESAAVGACCAHGSRGHCHRAAPSLALITAHASISAPCPDVQPCRAAPPPAVVSAVQEVCIQRSIAPPTIITESGRALASHHSVLVFDVLTT